MKSECMGKKVDRLLKSGMSSRKIAELLGCKYHYVCNIKSFGGWENRKKAMREYKATRGRSAGSRSWSDYMAERTERNASKNVAVIAAVDSGLTYREAAEKFGLKTRNVVAGIMNRRQDARAP